MATEGATYISDLTSNTPAGTASPAEGDDEIRQLKSVLKATLAGAAGTGLAGAVTASHTELNLVDGATAGTAVASKAAVYSATKMLQADFLNVALAGVIGINFTYDSGTDARFEFTENGWGYGFYRNSSTNAFQIAGASAINSSGAGAELTPVVRLSISTAGDVTITGDQIGIDNTQTPASASATGTKGTICWDENYIYVCTATDTWKRVAIATWP